VWPKNATDVFDDVRKKERNPEEEILVIENFCEPLVDKELWSAVQAVRNRRREQLKLLQTKSNGEDEKLIAPLAPGMALTYLLSGLVRCGYCGSSMRPMKSGRK